MAPKKFSAAEAAKSVEFQNFLKHVTTFRDTDGAGIASRMYNAAEVSCCWKAFLGHFEMTEDEVSCLATMRQRRATDLEFLGLTWSQLRFTAKKQAAPAAPAPGPPPPPAAPARVEPYSDSRARELFAQTKVSQLLKQIKTEFKTNGGEEQWSPLQRDTYLEIFLERASKLRKHLAANPGHTIALTRFTEARPDCVKRVGWRKCADTKKVQFSEMFKAYQHFWGQKEAKAIERCKCDKCSTLFLQITEALKSERDFLCYLLCAEREYHEELPRRSLNLLTKEKKVEMWEGAKARKLADGRRVSKRATESPYLTCHRRECCHGTCGECGVDRRLLPKTCPIEGRINDNYITYRKYVERACKDVTKNGDGSEKKTRTRKQLEQVTVTYQQFFRDFYAVTRDYLPHYWVSKWDAYHRKLAYDHLGSRTLSIMTDFSAVYACQSQDSTTCDHPDGALQAVFIVSYWVDVEEEEEDAGGGRKRKRKDSTNKVGGGRRQVNEAWHFWGKNEEGLDSNYLYHFSCLEHILKHYESTRRGWYKHVRIFSDGCGEQYKSKYFAEEFTHLMERCQFLERAVHTYAPTAGFKCACDAAGADTKIFMRRAELGQNVCAHNGFRVMDYLHRNMPAPRNTSAESAQFYLSARYQRYVVPQGYSAPDDEKRLFAKHEREGRVVVVTALGDRQQRAIEHMRKVYQLKVDKVDEGTRRLGARTITCWCDMCSAYSYDHCRLGRNAAPWRTIDLHKGGRNNDEEGRLIKERFVKDKGAKGHVVAVWVHDGDGGKITYGEITGPPARAGQAQPRYCINNGEWYVPVHYYTAWGNEDGVFVRNDDVPVVNVCVKAILLPPDDDRPPRKLLPVERRDFLMLPGAALKHKNIYIAPEVREEVARWVNL